MSESYYAGVTRPGEKKIFGKKSNARSKSSPRVKHQCGSNRWSIRNYTPTRIVVSRAFFFFRIILTAFLPRPHTHNCRTERLKKKKKTYVYTRLSGRIKMFRIRFLTIRFTLRRYIFSLFNRYAAVRMYFVRKCPLHQVGSSAFDR